MDTHTNINPIKELVNPKNITTARPIMLFSRKCFNAREEGQQ